jgi:hypothetical protein
MKLNINNVSYLEFNITNGIDVVSGSYKGVFNTNYWLNNLIIYER